LRPHTRPSPQDEPGATGPAATQVGAAPEQSVAPVEQLSAGKVHAAPDVQGAQPPSAWQNALAPQRVFCGTTPLPTQVAVPVAHEMTADAAHGPASQATPSVQLVQVPLPSQTWPAPHGVPLTLKETASQREVAPVQVVAPREQGVEGVHDVPATQRCTHSPSAQPSGQMTPRQARLTHVWDMQLLPGGQRVPLHCRGRHWPREQVKSVGHTTPRQVASTQRALRHT